MLTGHPSQRLDANASFLFTGLDGHSLALLLAQAGITAVAGSACATNETKPSSALIALGYDEAEARGALRFSLDHENTISEVDEVIGVVGVVGALVKKLRQA